MEPTFAVDYEVACSPHEGRWHATVVEPTPPPDGRLLHTEVAEVEDIPFAIVDLLAIARGIRPDRLRLLGPDVPTQFVHGGSGRRLRQGTAGRWAESWTALLDGDIVAVTLHSIRVS